KRDLKPRDIITRDAIANAVALIMAVGGSTNAVLHYLAIARAAEVEWTLDDFERVRQRVPVLRWNGRSMISSGYASECRCCVTSNHPAVTWLWICIGQEVYRGY